VTATTPDSLEALEWLDLSGNELIALPTDIWSENAFKVLKHLQWIKSFLQDL
jgi:hypothetical protein